MWGVDPTIFKATLEETVFSTMVPNFTVIDVNLRPNFRVFFFQNKKNKDFLNKIEGERFYMDFTYKMEGDFSF